MQAGDPAHTERIDQELCAAVVGIIDDDDDVRASLNRLIRADGHWTMLFGSAQEFLASGWSIFLTASWWTTTCRA